MENIVISGIKILTCENQIRLLEVVNIYKAISYSKTGYDFIDIRVKYILELFFKYISHYGNIITVESAEELLDNFGRSVGIEGWIALKVIKNIDFKFTDNVVNMNIYDFVYYKLWPRYLQALKKSIEKNHSSFTFRFNVSKKVIESFYENETKPLSRFKNEIFKILEVNGFLDCNGIDNKDIYTIEISE